MVAENQIENELVEKLVELKYIYRQDIKDYDGLCANFLAHFQALNNVELTAAEQERLLDEIISKDVYACAKRLREPNTFLREDGTPLHYTLVNINEWCKNTFEVINQLKINTRNSHQRYDVILLLNGIPTVQIELKTLSISPRRAMQQIVEYKKTPGNGYTNTLLCFMQLFIVSNRTDTWYFANNNDRHFNFEAEEQFLPLYQLSDPDHHKITHLDQFADAFLKKCTLGEMISRYMVLVASEQKLLMMRPYQVYAVKAIEECVKYNRGNGYIWHTTGSGKTLTSFKTSTLMKDYPKIDKCLFVVDRKDLDLQTRNEFNRFQEGCVEANTSTESLVMRLLSTDKKDKVIVTTIQKLGIALDDSLKNKDNNQKDKKNYKKQLESLSSKRFVFIFDECHRSQFGENHKAIKAFFPRAQLFGFTGTPIFPENATYTQVIGAEASLKTTKDIFPIKLHDYTITHAIEDRNVLRFHVEYYKPKAEANALRPNSAMTKQAIIDAILSKHDALTSYRKFNAIFACSSINDAIEYYHLLKQIQASRSEKDSQFSPLNIACVFSPPAEGNPDIRQTQEDLYQEKVDNQENPAEKKVALKNIIDDYNLRYGCNHTLNNFDAYYQDVQKRIKDQQFSNQDFAHENKIDITIVVDMLLTGFDSKYLNTLYVDKNLRFHGLIQAFSRTNRILNESKPYGNIIDFRQQQEAVNEAIKLFSCEKCENPKEIWLVDSAQTVIKSFEKAVSHLNQFMSSHGLDYAPEEVNNLKGDEARAEFIKVFKEVQRIKTQLNQYTDITEKDEQAIQQIIPEETMAAFRGVYLETAQRLRAQQGEKHDDNDPITQLDFEFVLFASSLIDYDYIISLIANYTGEATKEKMTRDQLFMLIDTDAKFVDEREDMREYINTLQTGKPLSEKEVRAGFEQFKNQKIDKAINALAQTHQVNLKDFNHFIRITIQRLIFDCDMLSALFDAQDLNWKERDTKENELMKDLKPLLIKLAKGRDISGLNSYDI